MSWTKIGLYVSIAITGILVIGFMAETLGIIGGEGGGSGNSDEPMVMLCVNPDCQAELELSKDEHKKMMRDEMENSEEPMGIMMPGMGPMVLTCPECNEKSLYVARKCEECDAIFIEDYSLTNDYPDRCPECDFSKMEDRRENR